MMYDHGVTTCWVLTEFTVTEPRTFCGCCGAFHFQIGQLISFVLAVSLLDRLRAPKLRFLKSRSLSKIATFDTHVNRASSQQISVFW